MKILYIFHVILFIIALYTTYLNIRARFFSNKVTTASEIHTYFCWTEILFRQQQPNMWIVWKMWMNSQLYCPLFYQMELRWKLWRQMEERVFAPYLLGELKIHQETLLLIGEEWTKQCKVRIKSIERIFIALWHQLFYLDILKQNSKYDSPLTDIIQGFNMNHCHGKACIISKYFGRGW